MILLEVLKIWNRNDMGIDDYLLISFGPMVRTRDGDSMHDYLSEYDEPRVEVNVSDRFYWATADFEAIETEDDLELLRQAVKECRDEDGWVEPSDACLLYASRKRNLQVMPRYMKGRLGELTKDLPVNTVWS